MRRSCCHRAEPGAVDGGGQRLAVRQPVAARAGSGAAADPGPAPGRHRAAPEPEREDGEHAQGAVVREDGDPRQHRAGAHGEPVRAGGSGTAVVRVSANG
ncbi:hypothetical protein G6F65_021920 [Rhizopus arrhizus]|nr:hypothetical protein G6F65_021920 [Rhizopus arrhizus]